MSTAQSYTIRGTSLRCSHCDSDYFHHRHAQLNTAGLTFFNLEWMNPSADVYVCAHCGYLQWFLEPDSDEADEPTRCLECGARIPEDSDTCRKCGWSYQGDA